MTSTSARTHAMPAPLSPTALRRKLGAVDIKLLDELGYLSRLTQQRSPKRHAYCTPGRTWLAARVGCSIGTISRHTSKLRELGTLSKIQRRPIAGRWQTNLYALKGAAAWILAWPLRALRSNPHRVPKPAHIAPSEGKADHSTAQRLAFQAFMTNLTKQFRGG